MKIPKEIMELFPPIIEKYQINWDWAKSRIINEYGSYENNNDEPVCQICFSRYTMGKQTCCGKSLCSKCDINL
jgi:hypothetical protein